VTSYDELLDLCKAGEANNVDLLYSDIDCNLEATLAVSLGKLALSSGENFSREDIAKSIIHMIAYNIGHVAFLAGKLQGVQQVCFVGNFLRGYEYIMDRISFAVNYWSDGKASALFMRHDGYFGAIGCLFDVVD
jgi:type II pantothenate kinase